MRGGACLEKHAKALHFSFAMRVADLSPVHSKILKSQGL